MRRSPPTNDHAHKHEWKTAESAEDIIYDDGAVIIFEDCEYIEQRTAGHSAKWDETFYETMYECDATRTHRFDCVSIKVVHDVIDGSRFTQTLADSREAIIELYDANPTLVEEIEQRAAERLTDGTDEYPEALDWCHYDVDRSDHHITITVGTDTYKLKYEHTNTQRQ